MISIEDSDTFKKEFNSFKERIATVTNDQLKADLNSNLTKLLNEVRAIDAQHMDMFARKDIGSVAQDTRVKIAELRQHIDRRLADWERSLKFKD